MALPRKFTERIYGIKAHNDNVTCLDVGETGRVLVTGSQDRTVNLWAIGQLDCFMSLTGHNRPIDCVRFAYNDDFVYSADDIGIIRRWDLNAQTICSTLNGHMKSVRTLDFNPSGEYVVSGSHDTTVRLWDVRNHNNCMKIYRGHISNVNSVKFSPDGLWIASAGSEGCVIIWDIRKSKQIMEFCEQPPCAAITCIQFHPFEFLLAIGRADGVVCMYDLENKTLLTHTTSSSLFYGKPIKCLTFSDNGECLFVGTAAYVSVIGWEPDREFDHIQSAWSNLGDMKIIKRRLFCGSYEKEFVSIDAVSVNRIFPFYNPSNVPNAFLHNTSVRKSFTRVSQKLRLSVGSLKQENLIEENENNRTPSLDGHSSPNLSLEIVDDSPTYNHQENGHPSSSNAFHILNGNDNGSLSSTFTDFDSNFDSINTNGGGGGGVLYNKKSTSPQFNFSSLSNSMVLNQFFKNSIDNLNVNNGPSSLTLPSELSPEFCECEQFENEDFLQNSRVSSNDSFALAITNYHQNELAEDFPVNSNNLTTASINYMNNHSKANNNMNAMHSSGKMTKSKTTNYQVSKGNSHLGNSKTNKSSEGNFQKRNKLSKIASVSTTELHKLDNNMLITKSASTHMAVLNKNKAHGNKENARNKNHITIQSINKAPVRSRTSLEMRPSPKHAAEREEHTPMDINCRPNPLLCPPYIYDQPKSFQNDREYINNNFQFDQLLNAHEAIFQELGNRYANLQILRNSTRSHDIINAVKQSIKIGRTVFVDLLGAILEKASLWNLDLCTLILPEIYELLQSQHKFYYSRACDTLRIILSKFLPIIQDNLDPWSNGLGVDITREERHRKCLECQRWLLRIRHLTDSSHSSNTLTQLQKMIVNI